MSFVSRLSHWVWVQFLFGVLAVVMPQLASTQTTFVPAPCLPLDQKLLQPEVLAARRDIVTANTISPTQLTVPSFWWLKKQIDEDKEFGNKFIVNWIAYKDKNQGKSHVDIVVNRQLWTILDSIGRYRFVNKFGTVARDYKYDVRVFNQQGTPLAIYNCDYSTSPVKCNLRGCGDFSQDSLGIPRAPLGSP